MSLMSYYGTCHNKFIGGRRRNVIRDAVVGILPEPGRYRSWLDIGTADQKLFEVIHQAFDNFSDAQTLDIHPVGQPIFRHTVYDGRTIPFPDNSFDIVSFIDVLHHTDNIEELLAEAKRVSRKFILIKDHKYQNRVQKGTLEIQDWFGRFGLGEANFPLPYNFLTSPQWQEIFLHLRLRVISFQGAIDYRHPFPFNKLYSAKLHFICLLEK